MRENALFFMCGTGRPQQSARNDEAPRLLATRNFRTSELHAAAKLRLQDYLVASARDTGEGLPAGIRSKICAVVNCKRKTYRYMLFTGLLVAVTDRSLHPRCLQLKADCAGAFDARSLCKNVVVPFEKTFLKGCLGGSCDPYVSNPARLPMVEKDNDAKSRLDREMLSDLYDVLEEAKDADEPLRKGMFRYAYSLVLQLPPTESSVAEYVPPEVTGLTSDMFFDFLGAHTQGASAVVTLAAFFRRYYSRDAKVVVHPVNESGSSSNEVGDIDLTFADHRAYAVEVKDKPYGAVDVSHACEKALKANVRRVIFAYGPGATRRCSNEGALVGLWMEKGVELSFMSIEASLGLAMSVSDNVVRREFANEIGHLLAEMTAPSEAVESFRKIFCGSVA